MKLGYTLLYVENVEDTMKFYQSAFKVEISFLHPDKTYGEMKTGETKLGFVDHSLAESHGFNFNKQTLEKSAPAFEIGFVTNEVEKSFQHAIEHGAKAEVHPVQKPWGQTVSYVRDLNGFLVEICSPMN